MLQPATHQAVRSTRNPCSGYMLARVELPVGTLRARVVEGTLLVPWKGAAHSFLLHAVDSRTPDTP